ncbi:MAG: type II secretion system GspH family protein [Lachnospiraceae bacterium]|nr:type II secretion system GspH family protein [Lachnospiraceae bacterium]
MIWIKKLRKRIEDQSYKLRLAGKRNAGTTMVELIVSFALLAIFLTAVTMVMSNALLTYYREQKQMSIYSVADTVLSEIREDIRTMQPSVYPADGGSSTPAAGYIKLRNGGASLQTTTNNEISGETIEFIKSNMQDGVVLEQIDAMGCGEKAVMVDLREDETTGENKLFVVKDQLNQIMPEGRITVRYYLKAPEQTDALKNYFMDIKHAKSVVTAEDNYANLSNNPQYVVWDVEDRLPAKLYQGLTVKTTFTVKPAGDDLVVSSVGVRVSLFDPEDPTKLVYEKEGTIPLQNTVFYNNDDTVYSEVTVP